MISNEKQYKITQEKADSFVRAMEEFDVACGERTDVHPRLLKAEREAMESQLEDLHREIDEYEHLTSSASTREIPMAVCSVVSRLLVKAYYNDSGWGGFDDLDALFYEAGAPGDRPQGDYITRYRAWLKSCNSDPNTDALAVLGNVLVDFMEAWSDADDPDHLHDKAEIERILADYNLRYHKGGVFSVLPILSKRRLESIIRSLDSPSLQAEFERSWDTIESDPEVAVTAACTIFESFCSIYIQDEGLEPPSKKGAWALWKVVHRHERLAPNADMDRNLKQILGGLASVIGGVASLRNKDSAAHGAGRRSDRVESRYARLAVNAAYALAIFLREVWEHRKEEGESSG